DVDEGVILPEPRLETLVSYSKGCYIGQETVARVKYRGHINRGLAGLVLEGDDVPSAGAPVMADDRDIGRVTSAVRSLSLGKPIALGYIRREHFEPGSVVSVKVGDRLRGARASRPPLGISSCAPGAGERGKPHKPSRPGAEPVPLPASPQPRGLVSLGPGGPGAGARGGQAGPPFRWLLRLPLVSRHGARVLRERRDRR